MTRRTVDTLTASAVLAAALLTPCTVLAVAWATSFTACLDSATSEACGRNDIATVQLVIASAGFVPVLTLALAVWTGRSRLAWAAFATVLAVYALWALFNDAATHGWDDLWLLPG